MPISFEGLFNNLSGQVIVLLAIIALGLIVVGVITQGIARTILAVLGIVVLIAVIIMLGHAKEIGEWLSKLIWKGATNTDLGAAIFFTRYFG